MTDTTEKYALMKCENCGYEEKLPESELDSMRDFFNSYNEEDHVLCPFCLHDMYRKDSKHFRQ